jgi:uncharacterized protein YbjT (DUF2867 family)
MTQSSNTLTAASTLNARRILLIGGTGFIGSAVVAALVTRFNQPASLHGANQDAYRITVVTRRRERNKHLIMLPNVEVIEANIFDPATLQRLCIGQDAVINLLGILHGSPAQFQRVHADFVGQLVDACQRANVPRLLHISALGASTNAPSHYLRTKAAGEAHLTKSTLNYTIFRPSVVFGVGDSFLTLFAKLAHCLPVLLIPGGESKLQPIAVDDLVTALINSLDNRATIGKTYDLAGPHVYRLNDLVALAAQLSGSPRTVISIPLAIGKLQALVLSILPGEPLLSVDNMDSLLVDNISTTPIAPELGLSSLHTIEGVGATYLRDNHPRTRFDRFREMAGSIVNPKGAE